MKTCHAARRPRSIAQIGFLSTLLALGLGASGSARAGLGGGLDSVQTDHATLRATQHVVIQGVNYDRHELTMPGGAKVREYVSRAGSVFAVGWSGRTLPDLKTVLGTHYADYETGTQDHRTNHHIYTLTKGGVTMHMVKLPRGFQGSAVITGLVPAGTNPLDLQ